MSQFLQKFTQGLKMGNNLFQNRLAQQRMFLTNQFWRQNLNQQQNSSGIQQVVENKEQNFQNGQQSKGFNYWVAGLVPLFLFLEEQRRKKEQINCFWGKSNLKKNRITGRIASTQYNANDPIEDRHVCKQLKNIDAYVCAVFDGHGGWSLSEYASKLLIDEIDLQLEQLKKSDYKNEEQYISQAITKAYEYIEMSFYELAIQGKIQRPFNVGSCALVTLIKDDKVYAANIGDCKGVIISQNGNEFQARKINHKQNANSKKEQERLKKAFPQDQDIVICKRNNETACYVKGRLMPTRAFGDYHLKIKDHFKGKGQFNGPYITAKPEIQVHQLKKEDKFIVMASDGLWDEMNKATIAKIAYENKNDKTKVVSQLLSTALQHAADQRKLTLQQLADIPAGERRKLHDDITIVCVELDNQSR
ncbi:hypothetical protein ABPG74_021088 [Tetrahymena malaccensis]